MLSHILDSLTAICDAVLGALAEEGLLTHAQCDAAFEHAHLHRGYMEDAIVGLGLLPESRLLRFLASHHGCYFVSTAELERTTLEPALLEPIGRAYARQQLCLPVRAGEDLFTVGDAAPEATPGARRVAVPRRAARAWARGAARFDRRRVRPAAGRAAGAACHGHAGAATGQPAAASLGCRRWMTLPSGTRDSRRTRPPKPRGRLARRNGGASAWGRHRA